MGCPEKRVQCTEAPPRNLQHQKDLPHGGSHHGTPPEPLLSHTYEPGTQILGFIVLAYLCIVLSVAQSAWQNSQMISIIKFQTSAKTKTPMSYPHCFYISTPVTITGPNIAPNASILRILTLIIHQILNFIFYKGPNIVSEYNAYWLIHEYLLTFSNAHSIAKILWKPAITSLINIHNKHLIPELVTPLLW